MKLSPDLKMVLLGAAMALAVFLIAVAVWP